MKKTLATVSGSLLLVAGLVWLGLSSSLPELSPDLEFQIIDGRRIDLAELGGAPLIVTFWATTCVTCVKKTPELIKLYRELNPRGAEMIAVAMSYDPPNRILDFSRIHNIPYPVSLDIDGSIARSFSDVSLTPTTFIIDTNGEIVFSHTGDIDIALLKKKVSKILETSVTTG